MDLRSLKLLSLELSKCRLVDQDILIFAGSIPKLSNLDKIVLDLQQNNISKHLEKLGESLGSIKNLAEIELLLSKNPVDRDSVNGFFESLSKKSEANILRVMLREV